MDPTGRSRGARPRSRSPPPKAGPAGKGKGPGKGKSGVVLTHPYVFGTIFVPTWVENYVVRNDLVAAKTNKTKQNEQNKHTNKQPNQTRNKHMETTATELREPRRADSDSARQSRPLPRAAGGGDFALRLLLRP